MGVSKLMGVDVEEKIKAALIEAGTRFTEDKILAYKMAIDIEENKNAKWVLESILENAAVAKENRSPLCDDTGIPHILIELGRERHITGETVEAVRRGVAKGLLEMPGRPMAINGNDKERIDQSGGLNNDPAMVELAPILFKEIDGSAFRVHIILEGGGPAIRGKTYRIFHQHDIKVVIDEIVKWGIEAVGNLGCSPCTLAVGIGRSHFEAAAMMLEAEVYGRYNIQSKMEQEITKKVNESGIGPLGLGGKISVLATFMKVGPQRASGVRIVCLRPCCCVEPRVATVEL